METLFSEVIKMALLTPNEIKELRKKAGLTQAQLAELAGVSQSLIARIEAGSVDPRLSTVNKIVSVLNSRISAEKTVEDILKLKEATIKLPRIIFVRSPDRVGKVVDLMKQYGVSQIPVLENLTSVGKITETLLLKQFRKYGTDLFNMTVKDIMEEGFPIVSKNSKVSEVYSLISKGHQAVLIYSHGKLIGLITKTDLLNYFKYIKQFQ